MKISRLDHFTLRTPKLEQTTTFFEQVVGLQTGPRPSFRFDGRWMYWGDWAALHLIEDKPDDTHLLAYLGTRDTSGTALAGPLDHIAFRCTDLPAFEARLRRLGVGYRARTVPDLGEHQVFVLEPNGITVEFIFSTAEMASWVGHAEYAPSPAVAGDSM
ncbi:VOC family protein [Trinickia fusca]|uniref:Extradiol dioxygenase n=1 Tax=Trinickia fusca TaxID=2419777 RepID=A0A494X8Z0_9BURK|nr:VOC family protein [Trinickia fusca]RKP46930.1 extradiol dioxygenase [Trinickia fusca]